MIMENRKNIKRRVVIINNFSKNNIRNANKGNTNASNSIVNNTKNINKVNSNHNSGNLSPNNSSSNNSRILALTIHGKVVHCTCDERDHRKCGHILHQHDGEDDLRFIQKVMDSKERINDYYNSSIKEKIKMIKNYRNYDLLMEDRDPRVRSAIMRKHRLTEEFLKKNKLTLEEAVVIRLFEEDGGIDKFINSDKFQDRMELAKVRFNMNVLKNDKSPYVRRAIVEEGYYFDELINDNSADGYVREGIAKFGYAPEKFVNDKNPDVRLSVAKNGFGLDKLINDENYLIRKEIARQGYGLDILIKDPNEIVRREVAKSSYRLEDLINDPSILVKEIVASKGYGLDILFYDNDSHIAYIVRKWLRNNNMSLRDYKIKVMEEKGYSWVEDMTPCLLRPRHCDF